MSITEGNSLDVQEFDAASESGVDEVREKIIAAVDYKPTVARYKVFIIDEVHDLSAKAFDALLKTVEEPPEHIIFILATTEFVKVPPTIRSRCQKFEFHRATLTDLNSRLQFVAQSEKIDIEPSAISAIARMADGGYRDALTLLEQASLAGDERITLQNVYDQLGLILDDSADALLLSIKENNVPEILSGLSNLVRLGRDPRSIVEGLLYRASELTSVLYKVDTGLEATAGAAAHATATKLGSEPLLRIRSGLAEALRTIKDITLPKIWLESELIRMGQQLNARPVEISTTPEPRRESVIKAEPPKQEAKTEVKEKKQEATPPVEETRQKPTQKLVASQASKAEPDWVKVHGLIDEKSATLARKLQEVSGTVENGVLTLSFSRKLDLEWVENDQRKIEMIKTIAAQVYGPLEKVNLVHQRAAHLNETTAAVELELQGKALYEAAQDEIKGS